MEERNASRAAQTLLLALGDQALRYVMDYIDHLECKGNVEAVARWRKVAEVIEQGGCAGAANGAAKMAPMIKSLRLH